MLLTLLNYRSMRIATIALMAASILAVWCESEASNLKKVLTSGLSVSSLNFNTTSVVPTVSPAIATAISQSVTQEFPLTSVSPAYTLHYNPNLSVFERSTVVPGPLFSERAMTLGKGPFNLGLGYSYIDFDELNGKNLDHLVRKIVRIRKSHSHGDREWKINWTIFGKDLSGSFIRAWMVRSTEGHPQIHDEGVP